MHNGRHRSGFVFLDDLDSRGKFILLGTKKGFRFSGLMMVAVFVLIIRKIPASFFSVIIILSG